MRIKGRNPPRVGLLRGLCRAGWTGWSLGDSSSGYSGILILSLQDKKDKRDKKGSNLFGNQAWTPLSHGFTFSRTFCHSKFWLFPSLTHTEAFPNIQRDLQIIFASHPTVGSDACTGWAINMKQKPHDMQEIPGQGMEIILLPGYRMKRKRAPNFNFLFAGICPPPRMQRGTCPSRALAQSCTWLTSLCWRWGVML